MKITCSTVGEFLENLDAAESVHRATVFYNSTSRPLNEAKTSWEMYYQLSAVLLFSDDTQALLEMGVICGIDRDTADGGKDGSLKGEALHNLAKAHCDQNKLTMLPGILDA